MPDTILVKGALLDEAGIGGTMPVSELIKSELLRAVYAMAGNRRCAQVLMANAEATELAAVTLARCGGLAWTEIAQYLGENELEIVAKYGHPSCRSTDASKLTSVST